MPALRAWQATYSWPFKITWAGKGGCPLILMVRWPQSCETSSGSHRACPGEGRGHRLLSFDVVLRADIPHRRLRPTDQDQKQALGDPCLGQIFFRKVVLALPCRTVDHGNVVGFGITANATG